MVECGNPRCLQEKRHFRKELQSWYKKVPFAIGLELVAEHLAGNSSGHIKTLLLPFNDMETEEVQDYTEDPEAICTFCNGQALPEDDFVPPDIPASTSLLTPSNGTSSNPLLCDTSMLQLPTASPADLDGLTSFYSQLAMTSFLYQQQQQQLQQQGMAGGSRDSVPAFKEPEIPLDLSGAIHQKGSSSNDLEMGELRVPEIKLKKKKDGLRRAYTDEELNAAVTAIQSGAIGTRRAAQLYGVPRSTLRNKVFKAAEMHRHGSEGFQPVADEVPTATAATDSQTNDTPPPASTSISPTPSGSNRADTGLLADQDFSSSSGNLTQQQAAMQSSAFLRHLEDMRAKHNFNPLTMARSFGDMFNPMYFGYPFFMPPQYSALMAGAPPGIDYSNPYAANMMMPYLPDLVKNLTHKKKLDSNKHSPPTTSSMKNGGHLLNSNNDEEDLKIPAYKSINGDGSATNLQVSEALRNMIRGGSSAAALQSLSGAVSPSDYLHAMSSASVKSEKRSIFDSPSHTSPSKRFKSNDMNSVSSPCASSTPPTSSQSSSSSSGKKRPKRGQYRKYDSELLAQAVKAVQRGEMSVHRAGTFFGVPHSTLEYKVKERHLLRKKKLAENAENKNGTACNETTSSISSNNSIDSHSSDRQPSSTVPDNKDETSNASSTSPKLPVKPLTPVSSNQSTTSMLNRDFGLPYSGYPGANAPASELLKKLHARAHEKANKLLGVNGSSSSTEAQDLTATSCAVVSN